MSGEAQKGTIAGWAGRILLIGAVALGGVVAGNSQRTGTTQPGLPPLQPGTAPPAYPGTVPPIDGGLDVGGLGKRNEAQQERSRNSDRQRRLVSDTTTLLRLATELKTDVDKTNKDVLSLDVIKKADEIEKLAHNVKERMKG